MGTRHADRRSTFGIRGQVLALSAVPLVFLITLLVLMTFFDRISEQNAIWARRSTSILAESDRVFNLLDAEGRAVTTYLRSHRRDALAPFESSAAALPATLATLRQLVTGDADQAQRFSVYERQTAEVAGLVRRYRDAAVRGDKATLREVQTSPKIMARLVAWRTTKTTFEERERKVSLDRFNAARARAAPLRKAMLVCAVLGVTLTLAVAALFGLRLARRLRRLTENAPRYAAGEPTAPIGGTDEIAAIDATYRELTSRLQRTLAEKEAALAAYRREHDVASTLQRALLPQEFPALPGLRVDAAYVPAGDGSEVGGDWYDVFALSPTTIGISMGDVAGHGIRAASRMGAVRQSIRTAARAADDPAVVLRHVNRVLCADEADVFVTAFFAVFDLALRTFHYALAGHPAPMVVGASGEVTLLSGEGLVLGVDAHARFESYATRIEPGAGIVLYTDGLVELNHDLIAGTEQLERAVRAEMLAPSANIADGIQRNVFGATKPRDDSAVLFVGAAAAVAPRQPQTWSFDAFDEAAATRVKRALLWQLAGFGSREWNLGAIEAIYGELASNVRRHTPGPARVALEARGDEAILHVEDRGAPFALAGATCPDVFAERGRGLFMINALAVDARVERIADGNRVSVVLPRIARETALVLEPVPA